MNVRLPKNLALLYEAFGKDAIDGILPGDSFRIADVEFVCKYSPESTADRFFIVKPLELIAQYREVLRRFEGGTIFELGIAEGGSTALIALLAKPSKLIAIDLETQELDALTDFIDGHGLADVVRPYYGVNQEDRARLLNIAEAELGTTPLDLVIDDASHQLRATRSSFETLFPRLRSGGLYIVEDWRSDHTMRDSIIATLRARRQEAAGQDTSPTQRESGTPTQRENTKLRAPLSQLAIELVLARAAIGDAVAEVSVDGFCLVVRRGEGPLDPETFRVNDLFTDYFGFLPKNTADSLGD